MKLKEFEYGDITLKYVYLPSKQAVNDKMVVVLSNPLERNGTVEFMNSLARFKNVPRLFIAAARDYQFGFYLVKDKTYILRDAVEALIEKFRMELDVSKNNTYLIGFCLASFPVVNIAINMGYNGIITEFNAVGGALHRLMPSSVQDDYHLRHQASREPHMDFTFEEFTENRAKYSGLDDDETTEFKSVFFDYVSKNQPQKLVIPKFYFLAGKNEESWVYCGKETCEKFEELKINYELTVNDADYDHMSAVPYFIEYFTNLLYRLGMS